MVNKKDVFDFLEKLGIKHDDTVLIHTSLKSVGEIENGADGLIDAFCEYLCDGLFIVPTHTWDNVVPDSPYYDVRTTEPCIGTLPKIAAKRADGVRSLHPTHSVAAFGKRAAEYIKGEELSATPAPVGGCWARLYDEKAKILLIGVGHEKNTYFHAVDEMLGIKNRLNPKTFTITITDADGKTHKSPPFHTHRSEGISCCCSEYYPNYKKALDTLGAVTYSTLGNALVYCCDAVKCTDIIRGIWEKTDYDLCVSNAEIPAEYYDGTALKLTVKRGDETCIDACAEALADSDLGREYFSAEGSSRRAVESGIKSGEFYVAYTPSGECAGFIWWLNNGAFHSFPYLHIIAVKKEFRGKGVGSRLLGFFEQKAAAGSSKAFLVAADFNPRAKKLYESKGYSVVGQIPDLYKTGVTENLMMKKIR